MITQKDFKCIGEVAKHCDNEKLCIATDEALQFDLTELFCDGIINEAFEHFNNTDVDSFWYKLWNGSEYLNSCGKKRKHLGLKRVWAYYVYSRYIIINPFNDTATGLVTKTDGFSALKPVQELNFYRNKYRNMGLSVSRKVKDFICHNKSEFTEAIHIDCEPCGCGGNCDGEIKTRTGIRTKIISK